MSRWDGNDYQLWTRLTIAASVACLIVDRIWTNGDPQLFGLAIFFLVIAIFIIPEGPRPPAD